MNGEVMSTSRFGSRLVIIFLLGVIVGALILVGVFVWPTRYRYDHMNVRGNISPVRIDRLTGTTEILYPSGWSRAEVSRPTSAPEDQQLPPSDIAKLAGNASVGKSYLFMDVYNGSAWQISEITLSFSVTDAYGNEILSRQYRVLADVSPLSSGSLRTDLGFQVQQDQKMDLVYRRCEGVSVLSRATF